MNYTVRAKFVFYYHGYDLDPTPSYYIVESDCPSLPIHGNVGADQLLAAGVPLPLTPIFTTWRRETEAKHKCFRCWATVKGQRDLARHREVVHRERLSVIGGSMKTLIIAVLLSITATTAKAWEFRDNPDRFPSVAFNVSNSHLGGTRSEMDTPSTMLTRTNGGPESTTLYSIGGDVRLPLSDIITLSVFYDHLNSDSDFTRDPNIYKQTSNLDGYRWGFSARMYLR